MENRKVRYTKDIIRKCLIERLREKEVGRITVTEICEAADINRSTFYRYYTDVPDLVRKSENEMYDDLYRSLRIEPSDRTYDIVLRALRSVQKNREMYRVLLTEHEDREFVARLLEPAHGMVESAFAPASAQDREWVRLGSGFLLGGIAQVWRSWITSGCEQPPERVAQLIDGLIDATFAFLYHRVPRPPAVR